MLRVSACHPTDPLVPKTLLTSLLYQWQSDTGEVEKLAQAYKEWRSAEFQPSVLEPRPTLSLLGAAIGKA